MARCSSILAWKIPWAEGPTGYSPWGLKELDAGLSKHRSSMARLFSACLIFHQHPDASLEVGTRYPAYSEGCCREKADRRSDAAQPSGPDSPSLISKLGGTALVCGILRETS